jgi:DNA repair protein RecO (recombination protein O)
MWDDIGFLLSKSKYNENSIICEVFTKENGKVSGIIFGGTSKKIRNYLQVGNKIYVNYNSKSENKIGYFKIEILEALSPIFFDDKKKLSCIISTMHLIKILTADLQKNINIFELLNNFYLILKSKNWIKEYIYWELELFKNLGYDLELNKLVDKKIINNELRYITKYSHENKIIPNFLIDKDYNEENLNILIDGLNLINSYLEKTILKPNNLSQPISRINFLNTLK